jgi:hypothetical protein
MAAGTASSFQNSISASAASAASFHSRGLRSVSFTPERQKLQQDSVIRLAQLSNTVNTIVQPIIVQTIKNTLVLVDEVKSTYEERVRTNWTALVRTERILTDALLKKLKPFIDPVLNDLRHRLFVPVTDKLTEKIASSYEKLLVNFSKEFVEKSNRFSSLDKTVKALDRIDSRIDLIGGGTGTGAGAGTNDDGQGGEGGNGEGNDSSSNNCLNESYEIVWNLLTEELLECDDLFEAAAVNSYSIVYVNLTEDLRTLLHNGIFTGKSLLRGEYQKEREELRLRSRSASSSGKQQPPQQLQSLSQPISIPLPSPLPAQQQQQQQQQQSPHQSPNTSEKHKDKSLSSPPPLPPCSSSSSINNNNNNNKTSSSADPSRSGSNRLFLFSQLEQLYSCLENDIFENLVYRMVEILCDLIEITLQEMVITSSKDLFRSVANTTTSDGVPLDKNVMRLINLDCLGEKLVRECERAYLNHFLQKTLQPVKQRLAAVKQSILNEFSSYCNSSSSAAVSVSVSVSVSLSSSSSQLKSVSASNTAGVVVIDEIKNNNGQQKEEEEEEEEEEEQKEEPEQQQLVAGIHLSKDEPSNNTNKTEVDEDSD